MEDKRKSCDAAAVVGDSLDGLAYVMDLVYGDMQEGADMRDVASVVYLARNLLVDLAAELDGAAGL